MDYYSGQLGGCNGESEASVCSPGAHLGRRHLICPDFPRDLVDLVHVLRERVFSFVGRVAREQGSCDLACGV